MFTPSRSALVLIDIQGKLATLMHEKEALYRNLSILTQGCRLLGIPILWCEQNPRALGPTIAEVADHLGDLQPISKMSFSCCGEPAFEKALKVCGAKQLILAGIEAHICVYQTAMDLLDEYEVAVISDAVSSRSSRNLEIALDRMALEGANRSSVEMILFELLQSASHEQFKAVARLVK